MKDVLQLPWSRLSGRAFDGAFSVVELPSLFVRLGLYAQTGRLELRQGGTIRAFGFRAGRLVEVETTEEEEAFEHELEQVTSLSGRGIARAVHMARHKDVPLVRVLRERELPDLATLDGIERAHARHVIAACLGGEDAVAWLDRRWEPPAAAVTDLGLFAAVWQGLLARFSAADRAAVGRQVAGAGKLQLVEGAQAFLKQVGSSLAPKHPGELESENEEYLARLGAVGLSGLARSPHALKDIVLDLPRGSPSAYRAERLKKGRSPAYSTSRRASVPTLLALGFSAGAATALVLPGVLEQLEADPSVAQAEPAPKPEPVAVPSPAAASAAVPSPAAASAAVPLPAAGVEPVPASTPAAPQPVAEPAPEPERDSASLGEAKAKKAAKAKARHDEPARDSAAGAAVVTPGGGAAVVSPQPRVDADALRASAEAHLQAKQPRAALPLLLQLASLEPRRAATYRSLGITYTLLGDGARAAQAYQRYLELAPGAGDAGQVRAWLQEYARKR